jgi:glycosyltransferase involved in cell wall biosynthesis
VASQRPRADVVVPFRGDAAGLAELAQRLLALDLRPDDTLTIADNGGVTPSPPVPGRVRIAGAAQRRGSYFARNRGAAGGSGPWIVFLDADVVAPPDLLDRLLAGPIGARCGVIGAEVADEPPRAGAALVERYAHAFGLMSQRRTLERPQFAYVQTACCAVRREAFARGGGFTDDIRSGGDADLCFRLRDAGWGIELRAGVRVTHRSRRTTRAFLAQRLRVGAGAGWLEERYPGFAPRRPLVRSVAWHLLIAARGVLQGGDEGVIRLFEGLGGAAFVVGTRLPNRRPL